MLADADQPSVVKLIAARGIAKVVGNGTKVEVIDLATRVRCAKAISDFLKAERDGMWPALDQGLETLGALRQESFDPARGDMEFLATAMTFLADPQMRAEVRARAVWATRSG